jgi:superfamily II DNA or RNA helicase
VSCNCDKEESRRVSSKKNKMSKDEHTAATAVHTGTDPSFETISISISSVAMGGNKSTKKPRKPRATTTSTTTTTTRPVELLGHQGDHAQRLMATLDRFRFALDLSTPGSGKTFVATHLAKELGVKHVVVVAPLSILPKWRSMQTEHGLELRHAVSYCSLRSVTSKQPKHGLLRREDTFSDIATTTTTTTTNSTGAGGVAGGAADGVADGAAVGATTTAREHQGHQSTKFFATEAWNTLVREGVLLVVDEIQNVKNVSSQFLSVKELVRSILTNNTENSSKVLLLSGTPIDKPEQVINLLRALNITTTRSLGHFNPQTRRCEAKGFRQILRFVYENMHLTFDTPVPPRAVALLFHTAETVAETYEQYGYDVTAYSKRDFFGSVLYQLFKDVILKVIGSKMPARASVNTVDKRNAFYLVEEEPMRRLLREGVSRLMNVTSFNEGTQQVTINHADRGMTFRGIARALQMIETAKIPTFIRVARAALLGDPNKKVVLCLNYTDSIIDIATGLAEFNPLIVRGSTTERQRGEILTKFQRKDDKYRLLIGNLSCLSTGIDLDDKSGEFPRLALVSPNYSTITLHQLVYRFLRADTRSDSQVHFLFGRAYVSRDTKLTHMEELSVLNALAKKSGILRDVARAVENDTPLTTTTTSTTTPTEDIRYPGQYEEWEEPGIRTKTILS